MTGSITPIRQEDTPAEERASMAESPAQTAAAQTSRPLSLWEHLSFSITHLIVSLLLLCLTLRGLYHFGRLFGTLEWLVNHGRRRRIARLFREVFGEKFGGARRRQATRELFMVSRCDRLFYLIFDRIPTHKATTLFSVTNPELLEDSLARGHGVHVAFSHHGPHHVAAMLFALRGYHVTVVRDRKESPLRRFIQQRLIRKYPEFKRMRVIFADSYPREIFRCYRDGYVVGSAMDVGRVRDAKQRTETATMFGRERPFLSGPLSLALRCKAPVLQGFLLPEAGFRYRLQLIGTLIDPKDVEDQDAAVRKAVTRYAQAVEAHVARFPHLMSGV